MLMKRIECTPDHVSVPFLSSYCINHSALNQNLPIFKLYWLWNDKPETMTNLADSQFVPINPANDRWSFYPFVMLCFL